MCPAVKWTVRGNLSVLLVPPTSIVTTSERTFVIRVSGGVPEWVDVKKGPAQGDLVEIIGPLKDEDTMASSKSYSGSIVRPHSVGPSLGSQRAEDGKSGVIASSATI